MCHYCAEIKTIRNQIYRVNYELPVLREAEKGLDRFAATLSILDAQLDMLGSEYTKVVSFSEPAALKQELTKLAEDLASVINDHSDQNNSAMDTLNSMKTSLDSALSTAERNKEKEHARLEEFKRRRDSYSGSDEPDVSPNKIR